jgi:molybdate transport system substrate-binding protein
LDGSRKEEIFLLGRRSMSLSLTGISSKATAALLADLAQRYRNSHSVEVTIESVGGVNAAKRVRSGEPFDLVVLDAAAIDALIDSGSAVAGSKAGIVCSHVMAAIPEGASVPDIRTVAGLKKTLLAAKSIGFSTGPSGRGLKKLIEAWGMAAKLGDKLRQAPPGIPVGSLIARGEVEIGFQQYSELKGVPGITVLGSLPPGVEIISTFTACVCAKASDRKAASEFVAFLASPETMDAKRIHGFEPA